MDELDAYLLVLTFNICLSLKNIARIRTEKGEVVDLLQKLPKGWI